MTNRGKIVHQENGQYQNLCVVCRGYFIGNKHRVVCKKCELRETNGE